jgi:hypothetical protein
MRRSVLLLTLLGVLAAAGTALAASTGKPSRTGRPASTAEPSYVYVGSTAQGIPVRLAAATGNTRWFRYRAKMTCNDGSTYLDDYFSDDVTIRHNRFTDVYSSSAGAVSTRVYGTLSGATARGTIRIIERFSEVAVNGVTPLAADGSIICDSHAVPWTAKA